MALRDLTLSLDEIKRDEVWIDATVTAAENHLLRRNFVSIIAVASLSN